MRIVTINGTRYATGLWWRNGERGGRAALLRQARETASRFAGDGYTCAVLRSSQYGLGAWPGRVPQVLSLAAVLADGGGSHLGVYLLQRDGPWWVCAVKDGLVAAEGDWLGDTLEAARAHAEQLRELLLLDAPLCCDDLASSRAALLPFLPRLRGALRLKGRLTPLRPPSRALPLACALLLALFMAYSAGFFTMDAPRTEDNQEARRQQILAGTERYFPRPWLEEPAPEPWAERCLAAVLPLPTHAQGWELESVHCRGNAMEAGWRFVAGASFLHLPPETELRDPFTAVRNTRLLPVPPPPEAAALQPQRQIAGQLYEVANMFELHLNLTWEPPQETVVREGALAVPVTAPWRRGRWVFAAVPDHQVLSRELYAALQSIPGLVVEQLSHVNGKWELRGSCYAQ